MPRNLFTLKGARLCDTSLPATQASRLNHVEVVTTVLAGLPLAESCSACRHNAVALAPANAVASAAVQHARHVLTLQSRNIMLALGRFGTVTRCMMVTSEARDNPLAGD